jgi:hypothetical protein
LGRFISRDPIAYQGSQWNLYEYAASNPELHIVPMGLIAIGIGVDSEIHLFAWHLKGALWHLSAASETNRQAFDAS